MCMFGAGSNPIGGMVPGDPVGSMIADKVAPEPVKAALDAPNKIMGAVSGDKNTGNGLLINKDGSTA
ncbi:hypothetical protein [Paramagnetospirillum kuznetsovii]|uniref:hypothetical protein n=1 Tax=Paramagnetospirillum kuznetsovii TaxID=2053833 RepID=UPI0011BE0FF4|nr:hypothetical protein [Paramagnetospirillum kuznetsovii]